MAWIPACGDIVHLQFDPSLGREMKGPHFGLVVSAKAFNGMGLALVCPISQGEAALARNSGFLVTLSGAGTQTQGNVFTHLVKSLNWKARGAIFKESAPAYIVGEVQARLDAILNG